MIITITGASAGIGRATAERLARDGATVVVSARRAALLDQVVAGIAAAGGRALAVPGDVTNPDDMRGLVDRAVREFGRLDVMICNAGIGFHGSFAESTPEIARRLFDVNVLGTINAAYPACEQFRRQRSGHVIAVSSVAGIRGGAGMSLYSATKAAQIAFIESLRTEFIGTPLRASVVFPVTTDTEFRSVMTRDFGFASGGAAVHQPVGAVADAIARCVASPAAEVHPKFGTRWLRLFAGLAPAWTDRLMLRFDRRRPTGTKAR